MSDLDKIFSVAKSTYSAFQEAVGKSGEVFREGRTMRYKATGYMYRWELHYEVDATDVATGITVSVDGYLNCDTAIENAITKCLEKVKALSTAALPAEPAVIVKELTLGNLESALIDVPLTLSVTSSLGRALQVPDNKIIEFQTNFPRDIRYVRTEILHYWLENSMCTWDAITGALYTIGERNIAEKIRMYRLPDD